MRKTTTRTSKKKLSSKKLHISKQLIEKTREVIEEHKIVLDSFHTFHNQAITIRQRLIQFGIFFLLIRSVYANTFGENNKVNTEDKVGELPKINKDQYSNTEWLNSIGISSTPFLKLEGECLGDVKRQPITIPIDAANSKINLPTTVPEGGKYEFIDIHTRQGLYDIFVAGVNANIEWQVYFSLGYGLDIHFIGSDEVILNHCKSSSNNIKEIIKNFLHIDNLSLKRQFNDGLQAINNLEYTMQNAVVFQVYKAIFYMELHLKLKRLKYLDDAFQILNRLLKADGDNHFVKSILAAYHIKVFEFEKAAGLITQAVKSLPESPNYKVIKDSVDFLTGSFFTVEEQRSRSLENVLSPTDKVHLNRAGFAKFFPETTYPFYQTKDMTDEEVATLLRSFHNIFENYARHNYYAVIAQCNDVLKKMEKFEKHTVHCLGFANIYYFKGRAERKVGNSKHLESLKIAFGLSKDTYYCLEFGLSLLEEKEYVYAFRAIMNGFLGYLKGHPDIYNEGPEYNLINYNKALTDSINALLSNNISTPYHTELNALFSKMEEYTERFIETGMYTKASQFLDTLNILWLKFSVEKHIPEHTKNLQRLNELNNSMIYYYLTTVLKFAIPTGATAYGIYKGYIKRLFFYLWHYFLNSRFLGYFLHSTFYKYILYGMTVGKNKFTELRRSYLDALSLKLKKCLEGFVYELNKENGKIILKLKNGSFQNIENERKLKINYSANDLLNELKSELNIDATSTVEIKGSTIIITFTKISKISINKKTDINLNIKKQLIILHQKYLKEKEIKDYYEEFRNKENDLKSLEKELDDTLKKLTAKIEELDRTIESNKIPAEINDANIKQSSKHVVNKTYNAYKEALNAAKEVFNTKLFEIQRASEVIKSSNNKKVIDKISENIKDKENSAINDFIKDLQALDIDNKYTDFIKKNTKVWKSAKKKFAEYDERIREADETFQAAKNACKDPNNRLGTTRVQNNTAQNATTTSDSSAQTANAKDTSMEFDSMPGTEDIKKNEQNTTLPEVNDHPKKKKPAMDSTDQGENQLEQIMKSNLSVKDRALLNNLIELAKSLKSSTFATSFLRDELILMPATAKLKEVVFFLIQACEAIKLCSNDVDICFDKAKINHFRNVLRHQIFIQYFDSHLNQDKVNKLDNLSKNFADFVIKACNWLLNGNGDVENILVQKELFFDKVNEFKKFLKIEDEKITTENTGISAYLDEIEYEHHFILSYSLEEKITDKSNEFYYRSMMYSFCLLGHSIMKFRDDFRDIWDKYMPFSHQKYISPLTICFIRENIPDKEIKFFNDDLLAFESTPIINLLIRLNDTEKQQKILNKLHAKEIFALCMEFYKIIGHTVDISKMPNTLIDLLSTIISGEKFLGNIKDLRPTHSFNLNEKERENSYEPSYATHFQPERSSTPPQALNNNNNSNENTTNSLPTVYVHYTVPYPYYG